MLAFLLAISGAHAELPAPDALDTGATAVPMIWEGDVVRDDALRGVVGLRIATANGRGTSDTFCSGTLIDPSWVLTAGHCVPVAQDAEDKGYHVEVVVGTTAPYADRATVDRIVKHPSYDLAQSPGSGHDLALFRLASPITAADPLPVSGVHLDGDWAGLPVTVVGYGRTTSSTSDTGTKRGADLVYVRTSGDVLQLTSGRVKRSPLGGYDVVGNDGTTNACNGDSGGASVVALPDGSYVLVGTTVVVYGDCEGGSTGATALDGYLSWIRGYVPDVDVVDEPTPGEVDLVALSAGEPVGSSSSASNASSGGCDTTSDASSVAAVLLALAAVASRLRRPA